MHILVSGGLSRIGRDIIDLFLYNNYHVSVIDKEMNRPSTLKDNINYYFLDLRDLSKLPSVVSQILTEAKSPITGILNLARSPRNYNNVSITDKEYIINWQDSFAIQSIAPYVIAKFVAESKLNGGKLSSVVNISSILSKQVSFAEGVEYHSAKAALDAVTRYSAVELGRLGVNVNSILPGFVERKNGEDYSANSSLPNWFSETRVSNEGLDSVEIANLVVYLLGPLSRAISGQSLILDKGYSLQETIGVISRSGKQIN